MVLTGGLRSANYRHSKPEQHLADFRDFCKSILHYKRSSDGLQAETQTQSHLTGDSVRYLNALRRVSNKRCFFETSRHYFGLGPQPMKPGDVICVVIGASTPIVLRPVPGNDRIFQLLGDCYVHGIMYGEALKNGETDAEATDFKIK